MPPRLFNVLWYVAAIVLAVYLGTTLPRNPLLMAVAIPPLAVISFLLFRMRSLLGVLVVVCALHSATLGLLNIFPSGIPGLQMQDAVTLFLTGLGGFMMLTAGRGIRGTWLRADLGYILFLLWAVFRLYGTPDLFDGLKDIAFFTLFFVVCMVSRLYVAEMAGRGAQVGYALYAGVALSCLLLLVFALLGGVAWRAHMGLVSPVGPRSLALFMMAVFAASLSAWQFSETTRARRWGAAFTLLTGSLMLLTLSRTVILTVMVVYVPAALAFKSTQVIRGIS